MNLSSPLDNPISDPLAIAVRGATASPIGSISFFAADPGANYLKCDGSVYDQISYPKLFAKIGLQGPIEGSVAVAPNLGGSTPSGWSGITYGGGLFVAVSSSNTSTYATSPDGVIWTQRTLPITTAWLSVTYGNGLYVAVPSSSTTTAYTSPDGIIWTARTLPINVAYSSLFFGGGVFLLAVSGNSSGFAYSYDGITWALRSFSTALAVKYFVYGAGVWIAFTEFGAAIQYSLDGVVWLAGSAGTALSWTAVAYGNGLFIAISNTTTYVTSPDGINWTVRTGATMSNLTCLVYGDGYFVGTQGGAANILVSANGTIWGLIKGTATTSFKSIAYGAYKFIAVGPAVLALRLPRFTYNIVNSFQAPLIVEASGLTAYIRAR